MYHVSWDIDTNGILLSGTRPEDERLAVRDSEMRPVFHEELDLLGVDHWIYAPSEAPLLWAVGRDYYCRGELVARAKGGSFYEKPTIEYVVEGLELKPIEVAEMSRRNAALLDGLAQRAIEFIRREYEQRQGKVDVISVAFSGGKDSVAVLDLVQRALPPDAFMVVFGDTTMELSATYEAVEAAKRHWPQLTFLTARSHLPAVETWKLFGPPSRMHRWCCSVHKSVPSLLLLREVAGTPSLQALVFDGIRWAESQRRSTYDATTVGGKHLIQVNASPIIAWSSAEVYAYTFSRADADGGHSLPVNTGYRHGLARVGCAVCPFASSWGEAITGHAYAGCIAPLLEELDRYGARDSRSGEGLRDYVASGQWKMRSGGRSVGGGGNHVDLAERSADMSFVIRNPQESWAEWAKTVGEPSLTGPGAGTIQSDLGHHPFSISTQPHSVEVHLPGLAREDKNAVRYFKAVAHKAAYCVRCRACEVECPTGALSVNGRVEIDLVKCVHCHNCLTFVDKGCWRAKSITVSVKGAGMKGINAYQTFGMSKGWLDEYLGNPNGWWKQNSLGPRQFEAMKVWLDHAGVLDRGSTDLTAFGDRIRSLGSGSLLSWAAIWVQLARRSVLVRWYATQVPFGSAYSKDELIGALGEELSPRTLSNALVSLFRLLEDTPLGVDLGLGVVTRTGRAIDRLTKAGSHSVPPLAVLYALYEYAENLDKFAFSISEIVETKEGGPACLFGLARDELIGTLRGLSSQHSQLIKTELARGLENVFLEPTYGSDSILGIT